MQLQLLDMGINIGFDSYGSLTPTLPDNDDMNKALVELLRRGYGSQIVLGHDITDKSRGLPMVIQDLQILSAMYCRS